MMKKPLALAALLGLSTSSFAQNSNDEFYKFQDQITGEVIYSPIEREEQSSIQFFDISELPPCEKSYCNPTQRYLEEVKRREQANELQRPSRISLEFQEREVFENLREVSKFAIPIGAYILDSQIKPDRDELLEIEIMKK